MASNDYARGLRDALVILGRELALQEGLVGREPEGYTPRQHAALVLTRTRKLIEERARDAEAGIEVNIDTPLAPVITVEMQRDFEARWREALERERARGFTV